MIKYKLLCKKCNLKFDSWFASSNEYERLKSKKLLSCHKCNSIKVEKTIMAPQLINSKSNIDEKSNTLRRKKGDAFSFSDLAYNLVNLRSYGPQIRVIHQISTPVIGHVTTL